LSYAALLFLSTSSENTIFISRRTAEHHLEFLWVDSLRQDLVNHNENGKKTFMQHTGVVLNEFHMRDIINIEHPCAFDTLKNMIF
jgi:hypothetical protein